MIDHHYHPSRTVLKTEIISVLGKPILAATVGREGTTTALMGQGGVRGPLVEQVQLLHFLPDLPQPAG